MEASETIRLLEERLARAEAELPEKAKLEGAARESETRHRLLIGTWAQAVWETDAAGVVTADSPTWRAYTGQTVDEWLGYGWLDAIHPDDRAYAERQWREAVADRQIVNAEFRLRAPDGGWRWTNVLATPVINEMGTIEKWAGINIDIDARKRAEAALRESEARYRNLFQTMRQGYLENEMIRDGDGRAIDYLTKVVNPQFERLTGIPAGEAIGRTARELVKDLDPVWIETYDRVVRSGEPEEFEREEPAFGRWFAVQAYPLAGDRFAILYDDITERKRAEAALRASEERFRALVTAGGNSIYRMSPDWRLMYQLDSDTLAPAAAPVEDWVEKYIPPDDLSAVRAAIDRAIRTKSLFELEHRVWVADGGIGWVMSRAVPLLGDDGEIVEWFGAGAVVTERKRAEEALRESEERYRALFESMDEAYAVVDVLKDEAGAWVDFRFVEVNPAFIAHTSMPYPVGLTATELLGAPNPRWTQLYGQALDSGEPIRVEEAEPTLDRVFDLNIFALDRDRDRVAVLFTNITERKRAEAALRESEERFQQFADASASGLWIRDANTLSMEFVSPAIASIYATSPDAFIGDIERWAAMIVPEDRDAALDHINQARQGEPAVHEFRIRRKDGTFRWIKNTDFPLYDEKGNVERVGGIAEDVITETKMAVEHQGVLLAELQHRVRNIMAMIRSTAVRSANGAVDVEDYKTSLAGRLLALARVQTLLTRQANAGGSLRGILESEIGAQAHSENQYELAGPDLMLSPKAVEVLTLAFHELATNALKYGALSVSGGKVSVKWTPFERREKPWLSIDWVEEGAPSRPPPTRRGFGSELIEAKIPYELRGTGKTTIETGGARCHIEFPLRDAESILETDAPAPTRLYGGTIDMTGAPDLTGKTVLVVEDDYYVASETAAALRGAGAEVLGPCPTQEDAFRILDEETPTAVVLDLNLGGGGPRFEVAHELVKRGTPFVFLTGYDPDVIPRELANVVRLQKPIALRDIVEAVSKL